MATNEPQKLEPIPNDAFPESVTIPITVRRVASGLGAGPDARPMAMGTYALNSPHMKAAVAIVLAVPKEGYDGLIAQGDDGKRALAELIANESGNQICALADRGSRAAQAPREYLPEHAATAPRTGGGILADAGHFAQPMVGAERGALERETQAIDGAKFVVDQTGIKTFDVLRVNASAEPQYRILAQCAAREDASMIAAALSLTYGAGVSEVDWLDEHATQFFAFDQLPPKLQEVSRMFHALARKVIAMLPRNQQRTMSLNKLVEAKDCAVRAMVAKTVEERKREAAKGGAT